MTKPVLTLPYRVAADGYVDHWLWAGPHATPSGHEGERPNYLRDFKRPVEWEPPLVVAAQQYPWQYAACAADHALHFSDMPMRPELRWYFAYVEVHQNRRGALALQVEATGQVALWINKKPWTAKTTVVGNVIRHSFGGQVPPGRLALFLILSQPFAGNTACYLRLRLRAEDAAGRLLTLPTTVNPQRRLGLEEIINAGYIAQRVCGPAEPIVLRWDSELEGQTFLGLNLRRFQGPSYMEVMHTQVNAAATYEMATAPIGVPGHYQVTVRPGLDEYYELNQRITQVLDVFLVKTHFAQTPEQDPATRRRAVLQRAGEYATPVLRALARTVLDPQDVQDRIWRDFQEEAPKATVSLSALMAALVVSAQTTGTSLRAPGLQHVMQVLEAALPDLEVAAAAGGSRQAFLLAVCRLALHTRLSSERAAARPGTSTAPDQDGAEIHRAMQAWMTRGLGGWDSQDALTQLAIACVLLATHAGGAALQDLSLLLLDKILFTLALNSWRGVYGAAGPEIETVSLLDARLGALAAVSYQGWGLGLPDSSFAAGLAMAHAEYEVPAAVQEIGLFVPEAMRSTERHAWVRHNRDPTLADPEEFHRWTFKTPDFMLSSLQDFRSGQPGSRETPWLATLGYAARVHVNQPEFATEHEAVPRNFWRGNVTIPRVAQWQETVVALYGPGPRAGLGYTHAHFPQHAFDAVSLSAHWVFACKDEGYLALYAANGLQAVETGLGAYRSLRSPGPENIWVCCLSRRTWDGDFQTFQTRVHNAVRATSGRVQVTTRSGLVLTYGLQGPLTVGGDEIAQRGAMHYDSPFCQASFPAAEFSIRGVSGASLELRCA